MRYTLILCLLLCGCFSDPVQVVESKREKSVGTIPEITEIVRGSEYGRKNALAYYWLYRTQAENIMADKSISAYKAQRIGGAALGYMGLKRGAVGGLEEAVKEQLKPWAGDGDPKDYPEGYCEKLMEIAESCRRAAK